MARNFDGTDDDCSIADITSARFLKANAWSALLFSRVDSDAATSTTYLAFGKTTNAATTQQQLEVCAPFNDGEFRVRQNGGTILDTGVAATFGKWYLIAVTNAGGGLPKLYVLDAEDKVTIPVNGTAVTTYTDVATLTAPIHVGQRGSNAVPFNGDIAFVSYFAGVEFSLDKIRQYLVIPRRVLAQHAAEFFWPIGVASPDADYSGNGRTLTVSGTTVVGDPPIGPRIRPIVFHVTAETAVESSVTCSWEALQGIRQSITSPWESLLGLVPSSTSSWESLQGIAQAAVTAAWEALQGVAQSGTSPWEALEGVAPSNTAGWEAAGTVMSSTTAAWESLLGIEQGAVTTAWEALQGVAAAPATSPWEALQGVFSPVTSGWEAAGTVMAPVTSSWESLQSISATATGAWESLHGLTADANTSSWEALQGIGSSNTSAWEATGTVLAPVTSSWEALAGIQSDSNSGWESAGTLAPAFTSCWESLLGVAATATASWEARGTPPVPAKVQLDLEILTQYDLNLDLITQQSLDLEV